MFVCCFSCTVVLSAVWAQGWRWHVWNYLFLAGESYQLRYNDFCSLKFWSILQSLKLQFRIINNAEYSLLNQSNLRDCISLYKATSVNSNQNNKNISGRVPFWKYTETTIYVSKNCYATRTTEFTIKSAVHSVHVKVSVKLHLGRDIVHKCNWNLK
jgi:hypothetical protein